MAAPSVVSVNPAVNEKDVVLGTQVVITFDQEIDPSSITESTFALTGPGQTQILTPGQLASESPDTSLSREFVLGTFGFALDGQGRSVVTFNPTKQLRKNLEYIVLVLGANGELTSDAVKNLAGEAMVETYEWKFTTGDLAVVEPPPSAPLPEEVAYIDPKQIVVMPRKAVGNDLAQEIHVIFPKAIDPESVKLDEILVAIEAVLGDPSVLIPDTLTSTARIQGNRIIITITGWSQGG